MISAFEPLPDDVTAALVRTALERQPARRRLGPLVTGTRRTGPGRRAPDRGAHAGLGRHGRALQYARQALDQASSTGYRLLEDLALSLLADLEGEPRPAPREGDGRRTRR
ncbi:hypothetical protein ACIBQ6_01140 [Nonomuraea sp. NPDC049655]|uniref:hypothetical protein n=1 Tax=Nonomuraea sp. NPDC049655 TaxID=3364355 RepID=UPI00378D6913